MSDLVWRGVFSILLLIGSAFFVAAEYALVGARRARLDTLARKGGRTAKLVVEALDNLSLYVAAIQIAITMIGIGVGSITEPLVSQLFQNWIGGFTGAAIAVVISVIIVTFIIVILGELVPKYFTLHNAEAVALGTIVPLRAVMFLLMPVVWLVNQTGRLLLRPLKIDMTSEAEEHVSKEELMLMVRAGGREGGLDAEHAEVVHRALRLDDLDAEDVMIHRLDAKWIDLATPKEEIPALVAKINHSRIPVCRGDIDEVVGILYVHDLIRHLNDESFSLEAILRPVEAVPENLTISRMVQRMREAKTHILLVVDEYGGTSGIVTLEDITEEIFGELDDQEASGRPPIERTHEHRISAKADVRYDELLMFLGQQDMTEDPVTDTLAQIMIDRLGRVPRLGDAVQTDLGTLRVENMARRRITRVALQLQPEADAAAGTLKP